MILLINTGGKGTRMGSLAEDLPKPMIKIKGKPMLEYIVDWAKKYNFSKIVMMNGYKAEKIVEYFGDGSKFGIPIIHSVELEPLGSGGAFILAKKYIPKGERFAYISGDHLCDVDFDKMLESHKNSKESSGSSVNSQTFSKNADMTVLVHISSHPHDSDILKTNDKGRIIKFVSKHDDHTDAGILSNSGLVIMEYNILELIDSIDKKKVWF